MRAQWVTTRHLRLDNYPRIVACAGRLMVTAEQGGGTLEVVRFVARLVTIGLVGRKQLQHFRDARHRSPGHPQLIILHRVELLVGKISALLHGPSYQARLVQLSCSLPPASVSYVLKLIKEFY